MQTRQGNMLESLQIVRQFLDDHADRLGAVVRSGARTMLEQAIADLTALKAAQAEGSAAVRVFTQVQQTRRRVLLHDHMRVVVRVARAARAVVTQLPDLKMPRGTLSASRLAHAAYEMADAAAQHARVFTDAGLPADFAALMKRAADDMLAARADQSQNRARRSGATQGLKSTLSAGRKVVHVLDAMVNSALRHEPALIAEWNVSKRVLLVSGGTATPPAVPPAAPAAAVGSFTGPVLVVDVDDEEAALRYG